MLLDSVPLFKNLAARLLKEAQHSLFTGLAFAPLSINTAAHFVGHLLQEGQESFLLHEPLLLLKFDSLLTLLLNVSLNVPRQFLMVARPLLF